MHGHRILLGLVMPIVLTISCAPRKTDVSEPTDLNPFTPAFSTYDVLALPGATAELTVKVERGFHGGVDYSNLSVEFFIDGSSVGTAITDRRGIARIATQIARATGDHLISVHASGRGDNANLFVRDAKTPFLVTDVDNTISDYSEVAVPVAPITSIPAIPYAADVLTVIARSKTIIYLTARDDSLTSATRDWLALRSFPKGVVVSGDWGVTTDGRAFKTKRLRELKAFFPGISVGVGNQPHDSQAYIDNSMTAYIIGSDAGPGTKIKDWRDILELEGIH